MVSSEPTEAYVFQPFGSGENGGRLWGIGGVHRPFDFRVDVTIQGLTKPEAEAVRDAINRVQREEQLLPPDQVIQNERDAMGGGLGKSFAFLDDEPELYDAKGPEPDAIGPDAMGGGE